MASTVVPSLSYGPLLFGGAIALMLSGIVTAQSIIFFKLFPDERGFQLKTAMVASMWLLDLTHSALLLASLFYYFVSHFNDPNAIGLIPWPIALTILLTAIQTCFAHFFYAHKIYRASGRSWFIAGPLVLLAGLRLLAAVGATAEMLHFGQWAPFSRPSTPGKFDPHFLFTIGLSLAAGTDAIITVLLCYYLRKARQLSHSSVMKAVLDTLTLYTLENGFITCLTTIAALVFWLVLPRTSLSLGLHFVIGKLYPNSLLVLLNTRKEMHPGEAEHGFGPSTYLANYYTHFPHRAPRPGPMSMARSMRNAGTGSMGRKMTVMETGLAPLTYTSSQEPLIIPSQALLSQDGPGYHGYNPPFKMHLPAELVDEKNENSKRWSEDMTEVSVATDGETRRSRRPPRSLRSYRAVNWSGPALP